MSYRKLSSLPLQEYVKSSLSKTSLRTVKDVLQLSPLTVMNVLHLSADQCKEFMDYLFSLCLPPKLTAYEMEEMEQHNSISLGNKVMDTLLHGGLLSGSLTEFVGPPGVGKTQWCLYITTKLLTAARGGAHPSAIYIDTESSVRPERIVEMLTNRYPELSSNISQLLSRIHMFRPKTAASMLEILDSLECVVVEKDAGVVVVDSIASMAVSLSSTQPKATQLSSWASKLKSLAHQLNICVIVTNQITTIHEPHLPEPSSGVKPQPHPQDQVVDRRESVLNQEDRPVDPAAPVPHLPDHVGELKSGRVCAIPALGNTWTHCITTRLILQYCAVSATRQIVIAKSPVSPFAVFSYIITQAGITIQEKDSCYSYSGQDPGQFRIRVQEGIPLDTA